MPSVATPFTLSAVPAISADQLLGSLNPQQRLAAETTEGPVLILAGAGSGKTKALTHRIAHLMSKGVEPWQILAVTFTNKAAAGMKDRIRALLHLAGEDESSLITPGAGRMPTMGTFHSVCVRILRRDIEHLGRDRSFVIYDSDDQERLMKEVLKEMKVDESTLKPKAALSAVSRWKSEAYLPKDAHTQATSARLETMANAYEGYQKAMAAANAMDFDDLLLETVRLFHECPDVLARYQATWKYLHVDEYQDTNHVQYLLIMLLAKTHKNLCVIGDPDQSIYGFRGADLRNILEFEKEYPDAKRIKLEQNYRSTQLILTAADAVIAQNPNRPEKTMFSDRKEGPKVLIQELRDERAEAEEAIRAAKQMAKEGVSLGEQVILYRTNAQSRLFEEACLREGLPYRLLGGVKFYARREVKDVLAYLHVILNPRDTLSLLRVINVPSRKIGQTTLEKIQAHCQAQGLTLWDAIQAPESIPGLDAGVRQRLAVFAALILRFRSLSESRRVGELTHQLLDALNMHQWLMDDEEGEERWQNVLELLSVMQKYDHLEPMSSLTAFLEEAALVSEADKLQDDGLPSLTLMTVHLCKGLEFEHVMVAGCEEGIFPHSSSLLDRAQIEEERRLMYVAMTRAKTHLRLLLTRSRLLWGQRQTNAKSRFLDDVPADVSERRSDDVLSAFAWASERAVTYPSRSSGRKLDPFVQQDVAIEFNQDLGNDEDSQTSIDVGSRIEHASFGQGTVSKRRGDVIDVRFDDGRVKTLALSVARVKLL